MLLLDTNIIYRWLMALPIPGPVAKRIRSEGAMVSILSPWEMLIKHQVGKLDLPTLDVASDVVAQGFGLLAVKPEHLLALAELPMLHRDPFDRLLHRDPFDRLLLAQAKAEGMTVVTTDRIFGEYLPNVLVV
ncbi:MAG: type II toxin-antitoxin system VapC family toxin [Rhodocyclales bacterium]|nr:type II toxin-antitoxin system VapC family toxin [Rhodocyclales bacterium]